MEKMLSVKEYCESRHISQTAIRKKLTRYKDDLEGHVIVVNRKRMLDEVAMEFLDARQQPRDIIIQQADDTAQQELEELRAKLQLMKDQILTLQSSLLNARDETRDLIEQKAKTELLLDLRQTENGELRERLEESQKKAVEMETRAEVAEKEVSRFKKSWFGFYRRKE